MKRFLAIIICCVIVLSLVGCGASIHVNVENRDELTNSVFGKSALVKIGDYL